MYKIYIFFLFSSIVVASDVKDRNDLLCSLPLSISFLRIPSFENLIFNDGLIDADIKMAEQYEATRYNKEISEKIRNRIPTLSTDSEHSVSSIELNDRLLPKTVAVKDEKSLKENSNKKFQVAIKEQNSCILMLQKLMVCCWSKK